MGKLNSLRATMIVFQVNNSNLQAYKIFMTTKFPLFAFFFVAVFVSCSENEQTEEPMQTYNKLVIDTTASKKTATDSSLIQSIIQPPAVNRGLTGLPENTAENRRGTRF